MTKEHRIKIYSLAFGGKGLGKLDGKVCFVEGALPGEEVTFSPIKDTKKYTEGIVRDIIVPSPDRRQALCRYYSICGGCQLQHLSYEKELLYKQSQVEELIKRVGNEEGHICEGICASCEPYGYRESITMHANGKNCGFYASGEKDIINIKECVIAARPINDYLSHMERRAKKGDITLKSDSSGRVWASDTTGERFFADKYLGQELYFSPRSFSQINRFIAEKIVEILREWTSSPDKDSVLFDMYCGVGFFSILLKQNFDRVIGMDSNRVAIDCAQTTLKIRNIENIKFYKFSVEKNFSKIYNKFKEKNNILLVDPPRAGLDKDLIYNINKYKDLRKIFYLSCYAPSLARDIKRIKEEAGFRLKRVKSFDMFPRTKHIETLAELERT